MFKMSHKGAMLLLMLCAGHLVPEISAGWFRAISRFGAAVAKHRGKRVEDAEEAARSLKPLGLPGAERGKMEKWCGRYGAGARRILSPQDMRRVFRVTDTGKDRKVDLKEMFNLRKTLDHYEDCMKLIRGPL